MKLALMHTLDAVHLLARQTAMPDEYRRAILDAIGRARLEANKELGGQPEVDEESVKAMKIARAIWKAFKEFQAESNPDSSLLSLPLPFETEARAAAANRAEVE